MGEIVSEEISKPGSKRALIDAWLNDHTAQKLYDSMAFLSTKGAIIAATPGYPPGTEKEFKKAFTLVSRSRTALITDLYLAADGRPRISMLISISAGGRGGKTLCMLAVNIDPQAEFYPLVKAAPSFFPTVETTLARKEGQNILFLNELNYAKDSALKLKRSFSNTALPSAAALQGRLGFFEGVDYRGENVFSAIGHIEDPGWAVITKIDQDTILAPVKTREYLALALIMLAALMVYGMVYIFLQIREKTGQETIRRAEAALRESEQVFREFMEHSPVYIFFKD